MKKNNSPNLKLVTLVFITSLLLSNLSIASIPEKYALLIGIDEYEAVADLAGTVNDVELMRNVLVSKYDVPPANIKLLTNEQASRQNIIESIQTHLIDQAKAGDVVILHYSGHGSQMKDESGGDEIDGYDETIVPHDSRQEGIYDISDDEINGLLNKLTRKTKNVTFILDSCHSGSTARAGNKVRNIDPDDRPPPAAAEFAISSRGGEGDAGIRLNGADYVLISGALSFELANETQFNGRRHGAMTWYLAQALLNAKPGATYRSIMDSVKSNVTDQFPSQHPQIEGPGMDLKLFGTDKINQRPYVLVKSIDGNTVKLNGGALLGLQLGSELKVYKPDVIEFDNNDSIATVRVIHVESFAAQAEIIDGEISETQSRAVIDASSFGQTVTNVYVNDALSESLKAVKQALSEAKILNLVESQVEAQIIIEQQDNELTIQSGDLAQLASATLVSNTDHVDQVTKKVKDIVHWRSLRDLNNSDSSLQVSFEIRKKNESIGVVNPAVVAPQERLIYKVTNLHSDDTPLYVYVLDVSSDGSVFLLYPPVAGVNEPLAAGASLEREIEMFLPQGYRSVIDVFKVIATTEPIDPSIFPQGAIRNSTAEDTRSNKDPLSRFLASASRGTRAARPVNVDSWVTAQQSVIVRPPQARTSGFTLSFEQPTDKADIPVNLGSSRNVCTQDEDQNTDTCMELNSINRSDTIFEMHSAKLTRSDDENRSIGAIFDEAYKIQAQTGAQRVEPNLQIDAPGTVDEQGIDKREILGDGIHDTIASNDDRWHLKQISVPKAWSRIREKYALDEGLEGSGIFVAHTDTGYLEHPENWNEVNGVIPIDISKGHDYFDNDDDAKDELLSDKPLDNPAHGTAAGSVIVSPTDCQLEEAKGCVNGVARGAQLIPLRVHRTVSQIDTSNLAKAFRDVADGNIQGDPKLVSTAMGGPPTFNLYKAVKSAEENGILILAAAGNFVRTVVWPARFKSTIAVAAVDVRCKPWKHSSRGRKIDISAPGESVWRATLNDNEEFINAMGKGTTFATGTTSGAAALWLKWHQDNPQMNTLRQSGSVTSAFRQALKETAWQPLGDENDPPQTHCENTEWNSNKFGPGILDVDALLNASLAVPSPRSADDEKLDQIPLFASLYNDDATTDEILADYRSLMKADEDASIDDINKFETEVMHHYTLNENVQGKIDSLVEGQRSNETANRARESLLKQDLSGSLRELLTK